jgi:hypothetical protein
MIGAVATFALGARAMSEGGGTILDAATLLGSLTGIIKGVCSAIKGIAGSIKSTYRLGTFIADDQRTRAALRALDDIAVANNLMIWSQAPLLCLIEDHDLESQNWGQVRDTLEDTAEIVTKSSTVIKGLVPRLPANVARQISDLSRAYAARRNLVDLIRAIPAPSNADDLASLKLLGKEWQALHEALIELNTALVAATGKKLPTRRRDPRTELLLAVNKEFARMTGQKDGWFGSRMYSPGSKNGPTNVPPTSPPRRRSTRTARKP